MALSCLGLRDAGGDGTSNQISTNDEIIKPPGVISQVRLSVFNNILWMVKPFTSYTLL